VRKNALEISQRLGEIPQGRAGAETNTLSMMAEATENRPNSKKFGKLLPRKKQFPITASYENSAQAAWVRFTSQRIRSCTGRLR
jgi:hypothetical protein